MPLIWGTRFLMYHERAVFLQRSEGQRAPQHQCGFGMSGAGPECVLAAGQLPKL